MIIIIRLLPDQFFLNNTALHKVYKFKMPLIRNNIYSSPVIVHDGVETMSNSDDSALTELTPDGFLNEVISFQVHSSCGFI